MKLSKKIEQDSLYLGYLCHLIADAIWFHRIIDKYIRIYPKKERINHIRKGYEDFQKLNVLLQEKYRISCPSVPIPPVDMEGISICVKEINALRNNKMDSMIVSNKSLTVVFGIVIL